MIEMLGVLAIVGVLSAGGVWGYNAAMTNYKAHKFIEDIEQTVSSTLDFVPKGRGTIDNGRLCSVGIWNAKTVCNGETPFDSYMNSVLELGYGTAAKMQSVKGESLSCNLERDVYFQLVLSKLPFGVCVKLLTHQWGKYGAINYLKDGPAGTRTELPFSSAAAETMCKDESISYAMLVFVLDGTCQ